MKNGTAISRDASSTIASDIVSLSSSNAALTLVQSLSALTPTATAPLSSATKTSHQTGVILGAAIGGAAVLALVIGIIVLVGMRRNKNKFRGQETAQKTLRDEIDRDHETCETSTNDNSGELAAFGPVPELQDSEECRKPIPELENSEVLELQSSTSSHRA